MSSIILKTGTTRVVDKIPAGSFDLTAYIDSRVNPTANPVVNYKSYVALLDQSGTNDPTEQIVYNNTIGARIITRLGVGSYKITFSDVVITGPQRLWVGIANQATDYLFQTHTRISGNTVYLSVLKVDTSSASHISHTLSDGGLYSTSIEVRLYN